MQDDPFLLSRKIDFKFIKQRGSVRVRIYCLLSLKRTDEFPISIQTYSRRSHTTSS